MSAREIAAALGVLGFSGPAAWEDVRRAYRDALMNTHPDATGQADDGHTSEVVDAFRRLRQCTNDGHIDLATVLARAAAHEVADATTGDSDDTAVVPLRVASSPMEVLMQRVATAMALEGEVSGLDHSAGLVQAVITTHGFAPSQLTAEIMVPSETTGDSDDTQVLFSLEPLGAGQAPPLAAVVERLTARVSELQIVAADDPPGATPA